MKKKIKELTWPLFAPIAFILWTVDYYLVYFGLSFFFYKLTMGSSVIKIILVLLAIPIVFFLIKIFYDTTFFTAFLVSKNKFIYFLFALLYSLNRIRSVFQYCSIKVPTIPDSVIIGLPCAANLLITFGQIILIFGLGLIFLTVFREESTEEHGLLLRPGKDFNDQVKEGIKKELSTGRYPNLAAQYGNNFDTLEQNVNKMLTTQYKKQISEIGTCLSIFELDAARYKASSSQGELFSEIEPKTLTEERKLNLGNKLNRAYQTLESEPDDFIDDEVDETEIVRVLGTDINNIMHRTLYDWTRTDRESLEDQIRRFSKGAKDEGRAIDFLEGKLAYRADKWDEIESIIANNLPSVVEGELISGVITRLEQPIEILGEMIDPDNQPILYRKAKVNKPELERQLKSIAEKWHEGDVRATILALESDLEHG